MEGWKTGRMGRLEYWNDGTEERNTARPEDGNNGIFEEQNTGTRNLLSFFCFPIIPLLFFFHTSMVPVFRIVFVVPFFHYSNIPLFQFFRLPVLGRDGLRIGVPPGW